MIIRVTREEIVDMLKEKYNTDDVFAHGQGYTITVEDDQDGKDY